ncbi:P74 [Epinotia aporema granulovirus]|uniref:p74 n=1 Tax=Epinotia aporema granulovirus TaxID=166056 RepID=K4ERU3_9BBAC|nr:P74 [Epinotia aporema granulovirus]AER41485.1 P74 [Epinotia aporema granulovirus]
MAVPTSLDLINCVQYVSNRDTLQYIQLWRNKFPHIFIDYSIRWATNEDFYVPRALMNTKAVVVELAFSREGCGAMSCYPYTATGVIDVARTPISGFSQTSNTAVEYNQPACFHLDHALAVRDGTIQSVELNYNQNRCVLVDSFTKMWFNSPYMRTDTHVIRGVDDVPAFDVAYSDDPNFPEKITGRFNEAYCRRFGRHYNDVACTQPWYETFLSFILGESIMTTFKLLTTNVLSELRNYDYERPSSLLPPPPEPGGRARLDEWYRARDATVDALRETQFINNDAFGIAPLEQINYTANRGFNISVVNNKNNSNDIFSKRLNRVRKYAATVTTTINNNDDDYDRELEQIITDFLQNNSLLLGILTDLGFNYLESALTGMLTHLNKVVIPALKRVLLAQSKRFTVALAGETYKAAMIHALNRSLIRVTSGVAKAAVRLASAAASVVNTILLFLTLADFVLMIWDPFGYSQMFPSGYLDDLSAAFLSGFYDSLDLDSREVLVMTPLNFSQYVINEEEEYFMQSMLHMADYLVALDINSNGQQINLTVGDEITDINEAELVAAAITSNDNWDYFRWYCKRHDQIITDTDPTITYAIGGFGLAALIPITFYLTVTHTNHYNATYVLVVVLAVLCILLILSPALTYFYKIIRYDNIITN